VDNKDLVGETFSGEENKEEKGRQVIKGGRKGEFFIGLGKNRRVEQERRKKGKDYGKVSGGRGGGEKVKKVSEEQQP